jgi:hypothetical protein
MTQSAETTLAVVHSASAMPEAMRFEPTRNEKIFSGIAFGGAVTCFLGVWIYCRRDTVRLREDEASLRELLKSRRAVADPPTPPGLNDPGDTSPPSAQEPPEGRERVVGNRPPGTPGVQT